MEKELTNKFADLDERGVMELVRQAVDAKANPEDILSACQEAMRLVGEKFEQGEYFVSDLMLSGQLFKEINELLKPLMVGGASQKKLGKVVIGTVAGDIHDIGKDLVVSLLEANNFEVFDLGVDQSKDAFISKLKETGATVVGLSGLLTIAFDAMKETVAALEAQGLRDTVKVMIGGGPIDQGVCDYVGADHWGNSAQAAVNFCQKCLNA